MCFYTSTKVNCLDIFQLGLANNHIKLCLCYGALMTGCCNFYVHIVLEFCVEKRLVKCAMKIIILNQFMNLVAVVNLSTVELWSYKINVSSIKQVLYKTQK